VGAADEQTLDQAAGILSASPEGAAGAAAEQVERKLVEILSDNPALLRQAQSAMEVSQEPPLRLLLLLLLLSELPDGTVIPTPRMERVADVHTEIGVTSGTSFTDETAEPGTFYSYHVVAEDTESGETTTSQVVAASASTRSNLATSPLTDTAISPDAQTVDAGGTVEYEARTTDWRQEVMPEMDFDWSLTDPDAGTLTKTGTSTAKLVASTDAGEYPDAIVAEAQGERHTASVTIKPGPLTSLSISPSDPTVPVSGTVEFDAAGSDAFGNPISDPGAEWSVTDSDAGTIDPETGLFTAGTTPGTYTDAISAAAKGVVETTSVTVQASDPPVASFEVDWEDLDSDGDIDVGEQVTFTDTSAGSPTSWEWDLDGDGTTDSTAQNPSFSYEAADSYTVTLTVANSQGSDSASSTIEVVPGAFQAVPGMSIGMGDDQKPYVEVSAEDTLDRATGEHIDLDGGIGGYQACVTYNPELIQVKDVQGVPSFEVTEPEIDNSSGEACFGGDSTDGGTQAPAGLARLHIRLVGPEVGFGEEEPSLELAGSSFRLFESATGEGGIADDDIAKEFGRGDARADGTPDIADAMFIAQTLADLRPVGESVTDSTHAVNAASVRTDGSVDVLNIADAMFIAQRLAGLRDELYE
ncbi:MAG: PKD domain-containing protein, partial [Chloroflexota bacterium]